MKQLYVSTKNPDKLRELKQLLGADVEIQHPDTFDHDIEENGDSLFDNALLKAREGFRRSGIFSIADDTGLEVDALNGAPGVYSSRYAGETASYLDNVVKLLAELEKLGAVERTARFRCVICGYNGNSEPFRFDGVLEGRIIATPRGSNGFGYDPVFVPEGESRTLAEMQATEKNAISHRGRALQAFIEWWNANS